MQRWTTVPVPYRREDAEWFIGHAVEGWANGTLAAFAIVYRGQFAGTVDLRLDGAGGAEVGFGLGPWARGERVMSRALRLVVEWGFRQAHLQVVQWRAQAGNWASRRVAWACGFGFEGTVRGLLVQRGERRDGWVGSLCRADPMRPVGRWLSAPALTDGTVRLRPWRPEDADRVTEACADALCQRWLPSLPAPYTRADAETFLASRPGEMAAGHAVYWCVTGAADDRCQAAMSLMLGGRGTGAAELGWWSHPEGRSRGWVSRAARLAAAYAFTPEADGGLGLQRILVRTAAGNLASQAVATGLGARQVGRDRHAERYRDEHWEDDLRYDLLVGELRHG